MKRWMLLLFLLTANVFYGQENFYNEGNIKIFKKGQMGFHGPIRNDGNFDQNLGLAGLYGQRDQELSGDREIVFWDLEIFTPASWTLHTTLSVKNNLNFIEGDLLTSSSSPDVSLHFMDNAFYTGDSEFSKVAGIITVTDATQFRFPLGDAGALRPISLFSEISNESIRASYLRVNPSILGQVMALSPLSGISAGLLAISSYECWTISGRSPSVIRITWDEDSRLESFIHTTEELTVVGWHEVNHRWENLGKTAINGTIHEGIISSEWFIPDDYALVTFGKAVTSAEIATNNYILTPNNDGLNDYLIFPGLESTPGNGLKIFNRNGIMVYSNDKYQNQFSGNANNGQVINSNNGLNEGIYYYILDLADSAPKRQGYFYISR